MHKKKGYGSSQWEDSCLHQTEDPHQTPTQPTPWSGLSSFLNCEKILIHLCCWNTQSMVCCYHNVTIHTHKLGSRQPHSPEFTSGSWMLLEINTKWLPCPYQAAVIGLYEPFVSLLHACCQHHTLTAFALTGTPHLTFFCGHPFIYLFFTLLFIHPSSH